MFEDIKYLGKATHVCTKCKKPKKESEMRLVSKDNTGICNKCYNAKIIYEMSKKGMD